MNCNKNTVWAKSWGKCQYDLRDFLFTGWMYLERSKQRNPPLQVRAWFYAIKALTSLRIIGSEWSQGKPMLYSYQRALPSLPVPAVRDTLKR